MSRGRRRDVAAPRTRLLVVGAVLGGLAVAVPGARAFSASPGAGSLSCPWLAPQAGTPAQRAAMVAAAMTLTEKADYVALHDVHGSRYQNYVPGIPRLCLPSLRLQDGPAGVAAGFTQVTQLPAPIALAATWNPRLAAAYGRVIGAEARAKGVEVAQGPMLDIARVPEWGRTFESYGEDPRLATAIAVADIRGIQSQGTIAMAKHLVTANQEDGRHTVNAVVGPRPLREIYLPPFFAAVRRAHVGSLMCAHNRLDGTYACQSPLLLTTLLRQQWRFPGFVRSDNDAVHDPAAAYAAGIDMVKPLTPATVIRLVTTGQLTTAALDRAVEATLRTMFAFGLVTHPEPERPYAPATSAGHRAVAARVAEQASVLLRNHPVGGRPVLPLSARRPVAVIGAGAASDPQVRGGGSSKVHATRIVTPLEGIQAADRRRVRYAAGAPYRWSPGVVRRQFFAAPGTAGPGVIETVVDTVTGRQISRRQVGDVDADFGTASAPTAPPGAVPGHFRVAWTGRLLANRTGRYRLQVDSDDGGRIRVGGRTRARTSTGDVGPIDIHLTANRPRPIEVDYTDRTPGGRVSLVWGPAPDPGSSLPAAVAAARRAPAAVVVVSDREREGTDRSGLRLPARQDALVRAVARANPRTVVVCDCGGPVLMPWLRQVAAVVQAWYPGELDGRALARVLFGRVDPSGRLPLTFPASDSATPTASRSRWPGVHGTARYAEGLDVGYRWYQAHHRRPLFPFGYGLSYTRFRFGKEQVRPAGHRAVRVAATVANVGRRVGATVVQVYLHYPRRAGEPPWQLRGFARVSLHPGQRRRVRITLPRSAFRYWDSGRGRWRVSSGRYRVAVGQSSADLERPLPVRHRWLS